MCIGLAYPYDELEIKVSFTNPKARLPVLLRSGQLKLIPWGRRQTEPGRLPLGGWARLSTIHAGKWDKFNPKPLKLPVTCFWEYDIEHKLHQFPIVRGQMIQGLLATLPKEQRVYVVTTLPEMENAAFNRWPRILYAHV